MSEVINPAASKFKVEIGDETNTFSTQTEAISGSLKIVRGIKNKIEIGSESIFSGTIKIDGSRNIIRIGQGCHYRGEILVKGSDQIVDFGDYSTTVNVYILCQESCNVRIGRHCMLSREIEIRTTDAHSVIDIETGNRLNTPGDVIIGDHVWVGLGAIVNKGSVIPNDTIVGAGAFVNKPFEEEHTAIAGAPAKVVRRGVTWNRSRRAKFSADEMNEWRNK